MLVTPREMLRFPRYEREQLLAWHSLLKDIQGSRKAPGDLWRDMASRK